MLNTALDCLESGLLVTAIGSGGFSLSMTYGLGIATAYECLFYREEGFNSRKDVLRYYHTLIFKADIKDITLSQEEFNRKYGLD